MRPSTTCMWRRLCLSVIHAAHIYWAHAVSWFCLGIGPDEQGESNEFKIQQYLHKLHESSEFFHVGWGKSRFIIVRMWSTEFILVLLIFYCIFHMNNCKPTFATPCMALERGFSTSILLIGELAVRGDCPLQCRIFSSIWRVYLLDANSILPSSLPAPPAVTIKSVSSHCQMLRCSLWGCPGEMY